MKRALKIGKKAIPAWLLVMALTMAGAGAAVGTVLAPKITGEIPVTVSQALLIDKNGSIYIGGLPSGAPKIATVDDSGAAFTAAFEACNGDLVTIEIPLVNNANQNLYGKLTLWGIPKGVTVDVDPTGEINNAVRIGRYEWLFDASSGLGSNTNADLQITIALADNMKPGFYQIHGKIEPVNY